MFEEPGIEIDMSPSSDKKALSESAAKWRHMAAMLARMYDRIYDDSCPLCALHREIDGFVECKGCPIKEDTFEARCKGTPWLSAKEALNDAIAAVDEMACYLEGLSYDYGK